MYYVLLLLLFIVTFTIYIITITFYYYLSMFKGHPGGVRGPLGPAEAPRHMV